MPSINSHLQIQEKPSISTENFQGTDYKSAPAEFVPLSYISSPLVYDFQIIEKRINFLDVITRAMSEKYKIRNDEKAYFLTITVVGWIDVFTRKNHKMTIINSLDYCRKEKGLAIYGYCLMPSHLHLIARAEGIYSLSDILRDFKKFTAKEVIKQIINEPESRRDWMLDYFKKSGEANKGILNYRFWQDGNHPEEISSNSFFNEKLDYIHNNPVEELIVENPEDYYFSSARNYAGLNNCLDVVLETVKQRATR